MCKIISGDKQSDNIPPIKPKVGIKTAQKILDTGLQEYLDKENLQEAFDMNKTLIDLECIPVEYKIKIKEEYNSYNISSLNQRSLYNFFIKNNQRYCLENVNSIINTLKFLTC